jgi:predicted deacylase
MKDWPFELVTAPAPGTKTQGHVAWGDPVLTGWEWPYVAVNGVQPGPAVLVTAGIHGSEYASIDAAVRLGATLDPKVLQGQVLCLPLMNPAAFWERAAYVSPIDNLNPNRVFPGKPKGSFTERLAHLLVEKAMRHADAYLDMHGGDLPEALVPFTMYEETGDPTLDARSRAMAEAFGSPALLVQRASNAPISGAAYATAARLGIPAIIAEDGGAGLFDAHASNRMLSGAENVLRVLSVLPGGARTMPSPRQFDRFVWIRSQEAGFFKRCVRVGDEVTAGAGLGTISDFFGRTVEEITTDRAGQILFLVVSAAIAQAGLICGIGGADKA